MADRVIDTPEFKAWFGDSKVVDKNGEPLVVYHGTSASEFSKFKGMGVAGWFSEDPELANVYAEERGVEEERIYPVYLSVKYPFDFVALGLEAETEVTATEFAEKTGLDIPLEDVYEDDDEKRPVWNYFEDFISDPSFLDSYDGIYIKEKGGITWGVFGAEQIKSAIGNKGTFDPSDPDITASVSSVPPEIEQKFQDLADQQRGIPEEAMKDIQMTRICQLYGFVIEHTGDLIHRMSEQINFFQGGYDNVGNKVDKVLYTLDAGDHGGLPFEKDMARQIADNVQYRKENTREGDPSYKTAEEATGALKTMSKAYADAHRGLPTYNRVQELAKKAAVALGDWDFNGARLALYDLRDILNKGPEAWAQAAMEHESATTAAKTKAKSAPTLKSVDTDSAEFKAWFGDSKVVDAQGDPMVVYHATGAPSFSVFEGYDIAGWFAEDPAATKSYETKSYVDPETGAESVSPHTYPVYLSIKNPLDLIALGLDSEAVLSVEDFGSKTGLTYTYSMPPGQMLQVYEHLRSASFGKYDGIKMVEKGAVTWAILDPAQAKSALTNTGEFDPKNPDITAVKKIIAGDAETIPDRFGLPIRRYWYHNPRARGLNASGGIDAYEHPKISDLFPGKKGVYLSPEPLGVENSVLIDVGKLDVSKMQDMAQAEGYFVYLGDIPAEAVSDPKNPDITASIKSIQAVVKEDQTFTPEFKAWFGDSKVVDENGQPLVVYHGTKASDLSSFDIEKAGTNNDPGMWGTGFYFSPNRSMSAVYGDNILPVYLSLQNPFIVEQASRLPVEFKPVRTKEGAEALRQTFIEKGYDGVIHWETGETPHIGQIVAFYPEQIKSVENKGTFDLENPDITAAKNADVVGQTYKGIPVQVLKDAQYYTDAYWWLRYQSYEKRDETFRSYGAEDVSEYMLNGLENIAAENKIPYETLNAVVEDYAVASFDLKNPDITAAKRALAMSTISEGVLYRGAESPDFGKGDFKGSWFSEDREVAAQYGTVYEYEISEPLKLADNRRSADPMSGEKGSLQYEFVQLYPEQEVLVNQDGDFAELWLFPPDEFVDLLVEKGYNGYRHGTDIFLVESSLDKISLREAKFETSLGKTATNEKVPAAHVFTGSVIAYHGTTKEFDKFDTTISEMGIHFSKSIILAKECGDRIIKVTLVLNNAYESKTDVGVWGDVSALKAAFANGSPFTEEEAATWKTWADVQQAFISKGYDGIVYYSTFEGGGIDDRTCYIVFDNKSIIVLDIDFRDNRKSEPSLIKDIIDGLESKSAKDKPEVFLGGECKTDWRSDIITKFKDTLKLIDPVDEDWKPEDNIYEELAEALDADEVIFFKGGEGTEGEKAVLDAAGKDYKEFDDLKELEKHLEKLSNITLPIKVGDEILTGHWKNHRVKVKTIGEDEKGQPTINGRPILNIRVPKLMPKKKAAKKETLDSVAAVASALKTADSDEQSGWISPYGEYTQTEWEEHIRWALENVLAGDPKYGEHRFVKDFDNVGMEELSEAGTFAYTAIYDLGWIRVAAPSQLSIKSGASPDAGRTAIDMIKEAYEAGIDPYVDIDEKSFKAEAGNKISLGHLLNKVRKATGLLKEASLIECVASVLKLAQYDKGCVMAPAPDELSRHILKEIAPKIPEEQLAMDKDETTKGIETEIHVTVLWGVETTSEDMETIKKHFTAPIVIKSLPKIGYFDNDETAAYLPVESADLRRLHEALKRDIENIDDHDEYVPHVTIAYLEAGARLDIKDIEPFEWKITKLVVSKPDGTTEDVYAKGYEPMHKDVEVIASVLKAAVGDTELYHGTSLALARQMEAEGFLRPRGRETSQWAGGPFGGNPSDSDKVYATDDRSVAEDYARHSERGDKGPGAIVVVEPDWDSVSVDEDLVAAVLAEEAVYGKGKADPDLWRTFAKAVGVPVAKAREAYDWQSENVWVENSVAMSDAMIETARNLPERLKRKLLEDTNSFTFSKPLRVIRVEPLSTMTPAHEEKHRSR